MLDSEGIRKLEAILAADVAGYSRLMQDDDEATVATLEACRIVFREVIRAHHGRVVDMAGDSVLAVFEAATAAVRAACEIQATLLERNMALAPKRQMRFRIGVNLGEVIERADGTVYGDGVNVAARLESIGEPGKVTVSGAVFDEVKNRLQVCFQYIGEQQVKNIRDRVRAYRVVANDAMTSASQRPKHAGTRVRHVYIGAALVIAILTAAVWVHHERQATATEEPGRAPDLHQSLSIAVLPFQNLRDTSDHDWDSDGMTETLITDLSKLGRLLVLAPHTSFTYKGKVLDARQIGRELGVQYLVEGSLQRTNDQVRITVQLIDAKTGTGKWSERYDGSADDIFAIQDRLTDDICTELGVKSWGPQFRWWRRLTNSREAYVLWTQAKMEQAKETREAYDESVRLAEKALQIDPKFPMPMVVMGWAYIARGDNGWASDGMQSYAKAVDWGHKAIRLNDDVGEAHAMVANALLAMEKHGEAVAEARKALAVSPNDAQSIAYSAWALATSGHAPEAVDSMQRAMRLDPIPPSWYYGALGDSFLFSQRLQEALPAHRKCVELTHDLIWCQLGLAVDEVLAGDVSGAAVHAREALKINPSITATDNTYVRSIADPTQRKRIIEALYRAGLK